HVVIGARSECVADQRLVDLGRAVDDSWLVAALFATEVAHEVDTGTTRQVTVEQDHVGHVRAASLQCRDLILGLACRKGQFLENPAGYLPDDPAVVHDEARRHYNVPNALSL